MNSSRVIPGGQRTSDADRRSDGGQAVDGLLTEQAVETAIDRQTGQERGDARNRDNQRRGERRRARRPPTDPTMAAAIPAEMTGPTAKWLAVATIAPPASTRAGVVARSNEVVDVMVGR